MYTVPNNTLMSYYTVLRILVRMNHHQGLLFTTFKKIVLVLFVCTYIYFVSLIMSRIVELRFC